MSDVKPPLFNLQKAIANLEETSKRASLRMHAHHVLVSTSIIHDELQKLLAQAMQPLSKTISKRIFDENGSPLYNFAACILIAYGFRLIDKDLFQTLEYIRKVRNTFAHSTEFIDLDSNATIQPWLVGLGWEAKNDGPGHKLAWWAAMMKEVSKNLDEAREKFDSDEAEGKSGAESRD